MKNIILLLFILLSINNVKAQLVNDTLINSIIANALNVNDSYENLRYLCKNIGNRISGSPQSEAAYKWGYKVLKSYGFDSVFLQPCMVPKWVRGAKESATIIYPKSKSNKQKLTSNKSLEVLCLGRSVSTPKNGITAKIVMVNSLAELKAMSANVIRDKILFINQKFDPADIFPFNSYRKNVEARSKAHIDASAKGALAIIVRSMTHSLDNFAHTGNIAKVDSVAIIPSLAISTIGADLLAEELKKEKLLMLNVKTYAKTEEDVLSYNVVGLIKGVESPNEIITVGGHLDSWDVGEGAHDDGAGVVQSMEVLRIFKTLNIKPKHTIHAVLFMNEENGLRGGLAYADYLKANNFKSIFALESDAGGFAPIAFGFDCDDVLRNKIKVYKEQFAKIGIRNLDDNGSGSDIGPLKSNYNTPLAGLIPEGQVYFDYHHTKNDTFDKVNKRELQLGAAAMTMLIYIVDNIL